MMIPGQAILIPMFQFLKAIGLLNTLTGLSLSYLGGAVAFSIFLMRAFFVSLPRELGDAARMDGAGEWGVFWYVYLPLARPGIATVVIIQSMGIWNEFMFSNTFISSPQLKTIQAALFQAVGRYSTDYTALSSGLMLALIPIFTIFLILQKQFIQGLTCRRRSKAEAHAHHPLDPSIKPVRIGRAAASSRSASAAPGSCPTRRPARRTRACSARSRPLTTAASATSTPAAATATATPRRSTAASSKAAGARSSSPRSPNPERDHRRRDDRRDRREPAAAQDRLHRPLLHPLAAHRRTTCARAWRRWKPPAPQGKIRAVGVSNFSVAQMREVQEVGTIDAHQLGYNLLWRYAEDDLIPFCREHGIAVVTYSTLAHGILTGKFARDPGPPRGRPAPPHPAVPRRHLAARLRRASRSSRRSRPSSTGR